MRNNEQEETVVIQLLRIPHGNANTWLACAYFFFYFLYTAWRVPILLHTLAIQSVCL
jgi:hypothetical protein